MILIREAPIPCVAESEQAYFICIRLCKGQQSFAIEMVEVMQVVV
jgi:hypothetical protein